MQTTLADFIKDSSEGQRAQEILRACVHCGFCTATCPTYQLLGEENNGPRGRIYLIKQVLEGAPATRSTQQHLDRCLTCRSCETTCPSGVEYAQLLEIGRGIVEQQQPRQMPQRALHALLRATLSRRWLFNPLLKTGQRLRPLLPSALRAKLPPKAGNLPPWPQTAHAPKVLLLEGCVQPGLRPHTDLAAARILDALGVQVLRVPQVACCGALRLHLHDAPGAHAQMRHNLQHWWPLIEQHQPQALLATASGCGLMLKEYALHADQLGPEWAQAARRIADLNQDFAAILRPYLPQLKKMLQARPQQAHKLAWHPPCTLQHGLRLKGQVEALMAELGFDLRPCADAHLCCGSAGTYSLLQPELSLQLRDNKLRQLQKTQPEQIVTANIGCQMHLQSGTEVPVSHWVELLAQALFDD